MDIKKNDIIYILLITILSGFAAIAVGNPELPIGRNSILGLLGFGLALTILIKPNIGANILVIAIFTNISDLLTNQGYTGILKPLIVLVFAAILVRNVYARQIPWERPRTAQIETFLLVYFVIVAASFLVASDNGKASQVIIDFGKDLIIIYCILFSVRSLEVWKGVVWVVILTTFALCLLGVYQTLTGNYDQRFFGLASVQNQQVFGDATTPRTSGPVNAPNMWGQILVSVIPLVVYRFLDERSRLIKFLAVGIGSVILFGILNTYSRGAYLGLFVVVALVIVEKRPNILGLVVTLMLGTLLLSALPATYAERFQTLSFLSPTSQNGIYQDSSLVGRSSEMLTGLYMFTSHPILGVGAGNYSTNYLKYAQIVGLEFRAEERDPHSLYIQVIAETGILGFVAFIGVIISVFMGLSKAKRAAGFMPQGRSLLPWISSLQASIAGYLVSAVFLHGAYIRYFWILVALVITVVQLTNENLHSNDERFLKNGSSK